MKITKSVNIALLSLVRFAIPMTGHCQTYTLSTPISGYMTMSARDTNGLAGSYGGLTYNFSTLTETIYLNPVTQTIRQVGTITGTPSASNFSFQDIQQIPGTFPNPPTSVTGNVTVALAPTGGGLSFDTGPNPVTWNPAAGGYTFTPQVVSINNLGGSYTLVTGGQTYSGSFTYQLLGTGGGFWANPFDTVSTTGYPNSLTLSGLGTSYGNSIPQFSSSPNVVADVAGGNGFNMALSVGDVNNFGTYVESFSWTSPGTITATLVPEPTSLSLLALGAVALLGGRRLRRRSS